MPIVSFKKLCLSKTCPQLKSLLQCPPSGLLVKALCAHANALSAILLQHTGFHAEPTSANSTMPTIKTTKTGNLPSNDTCIDLRCASRFVIVRPLTARWVNYSVFQKQARSCNRAIQHTSSKPRHKAKAGHRTKTCFA